jgi:hypothetical protein
VSWNDLGPTYQLLTQVQAWTMSDGTTQETPEFQMLLSKIPQVDLPSGMIAHAKMQWIVEEREQKVEIDYFL